MLAPSVTLIAIHTVVYISAHAPVFRIGLGLGMTICAGEDGVVARIRVAGAAHSVGAAVIQREIGVIELSIRPLDRIMAGRAGGRELGRDVIRIGRVLVVRLMTAVAIRGQARVVVVDVAVDACSRRYYVRAGQREASLAVVEGGVGPLDRVVTDLAGLRESSGHVVRILGVVEIRQVASDTSRVV